MKLFRVEEPPLPSFSATHPSTRAHLALRRSVIAGVWHRSKRDISKVGIPSYGIGLKR